MSRLLPLYSRPMFSRTIVPLTLLGTLLLTGCSFAGTQASAIPLFAHGTGVTLEDALPQPWRRQAIGDSGLSIEFPTLLNISRMGGPTNALYNLNGTGVSIFAFKRPYIENGDEFDQFIWKLRAEGSGGCKVIGEDLGRLLDIDVLRAHRCKEVTTADGKVYNVLGYSAAADVVEMASAMVFLGPDTMMLFDGVFSMEQVSPEAAAEIASYFAAHKQVTQRWPEDRNVQLLDRILRTILDRDITKPSAHVASAFAFMERVALSAQWLVQK